MVNRRKRPPTSIAALPKPGNRIWLARIVDIALLILASGLSLGVLVSFLTRPLVPYSLAADVGMVKCRFREMPVFDGQQFADTPAHFHLTTVSIVATATEIYALQPPKSSPTATRLTPLGPQSFAVLSCAPKASVRIFMLPRRTMTILRPGTFRFLDRAYSGGTKPPAEYSVGLAFDYPNGSKVWTIQASQETDIHAASFDYGHPQPISPEIMEGSLFKGLARSFVGASAVLDRGLQVPAVGQRVVIDSPGGIRQDYQPMLYVTTPNTRDPLSEQPIDCEAIDLTDLKGRIIVDGNARSVDGAENLFTSDASAELRFAPTDSSLSVRVRGSSASLLLDGAQLVPSRAGRFGVQEPILAGTIGTILATLLIILFVTRGRAVLKWIRRET